ncbi:MAG: GNAT family N-acetyltransferase [Ruminococcaceae bacterium]|nr:GNAT family N-acetyltransferase [Oscillospiraceae bacterium]
MEFEIREILSPDEKELTKIASLWSDSFGDSLEFICDFYNKMPIHSTVCIFCKDIPVSMAVLLCVGEGYYGYAVCTHRDYRGKGLCKGIHEYIKEKCQREGKEYFIHPADESLEGFYERLGMTTVASCYEVRTVAYENERVRRISASEYARIRDLYFGGFRYYPWKSEALSFMEENGTEFLSVEIDGIECAAAREGSVILELCAPDHLFGKSASSFLTGGEYLGKVRFLSPPNHLDAPAVMSFSGREVYFNLFFE